MVALQRCKRAPEYESTRERERERMRGDEKERKKIEVDKGVRFL